MEISPRRDNITCCWHPVKISLCAWADPHHDYWLRQQWLEDNAIRFLQAVYLKRIHPLSSGNMSVIMLLEPKSDTRLFLRALSYGPSQPQRPWSTLIPTWRAREWPPCPKTNKQKHRSTVTLTAVWLHCSPPPSSRLSHLDLCLF